MSLILPFMSATSLLLAPSLSYIIFFSLYYILIRISLSIHSYATLSFYSLFHSAILSNSNWVYPTLAYNLISFKLL